MPELRASLQIPFGRPEDPTPFELVEADEDRSLVRHALYQNLNWYGGPPPALRVPGQETFVAQSILMYGYVTLRLYHALGVSPTVISLDPPQESEPEDQRYRYGIYSYGPYTSGFAGDLVVAQGRRTAVQREALTWQGQREARIRYWYDDPAVTVVYASQFVDSQGQPAAAPVYKGAGRFAANGLVTGAMLVQYSAGYTRYRVYYDVPGTGVRFWTDDSGHRVRYLAPNEPPRLQVYARAGQQISLARVERRLASFVPPPQTEDQEKEKRFTQQSRQSAQKRIENEIDPNQFVDVDRPTEVQFLNQTTGEILILELPEEP